MAIDYSGTSQYHLSTGVPVTEAPFTIACWFNSDVTNAQDIIVSLAHSSSDNDHFRLVLAGTLGGDPIAASATSSVAGSGNAISSTGFASGVWNHACAVFASTISRDVLLNGGGKGSNTTSIVPTAIDRLGLGVTGRLTLSEFYNGKLAEVGIWNVALTDEEVLALAKGFSPLCVRLGSLVFYAPLIREVQDICGGLVLTATGPPTVFQHPRIILPHKLSIGFPVIQSTGKKYTGGMHALRGERGSHRRILVA